MFKIKIKSLLFVILILTYCLTSSDTGGSISSGFKYIALLSCVVYSLYDYSRKPRNRYMYTEYKNLMYFIVCVVLYSLFRSLMASHFSFRTIQELIFLVMPMIYGYLVINTWSKNDIEKAFKYGVIISFACYIASLKMNFSELLFSLLSSSFSTSYSDLESFTFCGLALSFCLYFCYYKKNKFFMLLSCLFVIMTFKRLFIVIAVILFFLAQLQFREKKINKRFVGLCIVGLFVFAIVYYYIMQPDIVPILESRFGINISKITSTRSDRMRWLILSNFKTYGFGSTTEYMYTMFNGALEMDASKIIIELGFLPLFLFFQAYLRFASRNVYTFVFILFMMLNLILSSGLTGAFAWSIIFISISTITIYPEKS